MHRFPHDSAFPGDGELSRLIRAHDWAATPLGPIADWPQSLRVAVRIMLDSRYAMWLGWGAHLTFLYNDAYAHMTLGAKHPWALGRSVREVWSEIWADIGPRAERVLTTGKATWDEGLLLFLERRGFPEETFHTFSYSPLPDDAGAVGGLLCVVTEDTDRTIGERRLKTLRELAARTTEATASAEDACRAAALTLAVNPHDLPFALLYLLDADGRAARLAGTAGLDPAAPAAPAVVELAGAGGAADWPLRGVMETGRAAVVTDVAARLGSAPVGVYPEPPHTAVVLPMRRSGFDRPAGFLVAGTSPRRPLDDGYRGFLDLLAGQVATAVSNARAYEEERRRAEALAELDRAKTAFFSNVSHEFRTPLTLMLGPVDDLLATADGRLPPGGRELLEVVRRNGLRLQKLVNTLLDFSRIEAGRVRARFEATDLAALTADLASNFRSACERAGLAFVVDCPPVGEPVFVDRDMWEKVVLNLVSNAFKFTLRGRIEVRLRPGAGCAELEVRDTGTGIPADQMPHLFERFHRVEGARGRTLEGSGIGLALVRELVRLHGGEVRAESRPGAGSTFTVRIPLGTAHLPPDRTRAEEPPAPTVGRAAAYVEEALRWLPSDAADSSEGAGADPSAAADPSGERGGASPPTGSDRPRVLLADDNSDMREYVRRLLAGRYEVEAVTNGADAVAAARRAPPALVLSDVMMPGLDGFGLLRELRADPGTAAIPVILVSARAGEEARVEGLRAGADDYLTKPFGARELLARVDAHLALDRLRRDVERRASTILESITDAFFAVDRGWRFTYLNRQAEELLGRTRADLSGKNAWDEFGPAVGTTFHHHLLRAAGEQTAVHFEGYYPPHGRWYEVRAYPSAVGLSVYFRDVSARRRAADAEHVLAEAGAALASSLDYETTLAAVARLAVPRLADWCSVYLTDAGNGLRRVAVAHADPAKVAWAERIAQRYPPDPNDPRGVGGVLASGAPVLIPDVTDELLVAGTRDPDHLALLRELGLRSVMIVPLVARDRTVGAITFVAAESGRRYGPADLALAQELARRAALAVDNARLFHASAESLRRLGGLIEASGLLTRSLEPAAVQAAVLDLSHRLVAADAHAVWRIDAAAGEWRIADSANLSDAYLRDAARVPFTPDTTPTRPVVAEDAQAATALEARRAALRAERVESLLALPLHVHGAVAGTLVFYYRTRRTFDDVTVRVGCALADLAGAALGSAELYRRERDSRRRAEEADRAKDEFLALLGHELRNPIAPIKNALQILTLKGNDPTAVSRAGAIIDRQATHLTRLVDELLDASRVTRGKVRLTVERLDLAALVRTAVEDHRAGVEKAGLTLAVDVPPAPVRVRGDPARLTQVVTNLLANAAKFTPAGGHVRVALGTAEGAAVLTVSDTGVGLALADLPTLFRPFHQVNVEPARTKGGLGLGLAVVKGLVELHGGRVEGFSAGLGAGAAFTVRLPLDAAPDPATAPAPAPAPRAAGGGRRVVIVEDVADTAESLAEVLQLKGFAVSIAATGPDGVALCRRERPDAVVCDLGLPGMTGFEVARALRGDPVVAGAVLVAVSGYAQDEDRRKARDAGFDALLAKPADTDELARLLIRPRS
jgi:PAS domain S-box-containing protein